MHKLLLLANPAALNRDKSNLPRILSVFRQAGTSVDLRKTTANRGAGAIAKQAAQSGFDGIVACGGDGTVFDVLQGMAGSELPLGVIPLGTGNVLAQNLGMPHDPAAAAASILSGRVQSTELGRLVCGTGAEAESWYFVMSAGMGAHAAIMMATRRSRKNRLGKAAYYAAGLKHFLSQPARPFEIEACDLDGRKSVRRVSEAIALRVSKLNVWRPGGGLELPFLRLVSVEAGPRVRVAQAAFDSLVRAAGERGRMLPVKSPALYQDIVKVTCRPLSEPEGHKMEGRDPLPIPVQADGEVLGSSYATMEMAGLSLRLITAII